MLEKNLKNKRGQAKDHSGVVVIEDSKFKDQLFLFQKLNLNYFCCNDASCMPLRMHIQNKNKVLQFKTVC